jgi:hypothetical protein
MADVAPSQGVIADWVDRLQKEFANRTAPVRAETYLRKWASGSRPVMFSCEDGQVYVVKSKYAGRQAINDQIVGHLGAAMGAPTGRPALVRVEQELVNAERELQDLHGSGPFIPGVWHGSLHVGNVSDDRDSFAHQNVPENRPRFAQLAILYGWAYTGSDHQFLYAKVEPRIVFSVDHGHFFPEGPNWTIEGLQRFANTKAVPDPAIVGNCALTAAEIRAAEVALSGLDKDVVIARAVAAPLEEWVLSMEERVAMAHYLAQRHRELITAIAALPA